MSSVNVRVPLKFAAAVDDAPIVLAIRPTHRGSDEYVVEFFESDDNAPPPVVVANLLRRYADQYARTHTPPSSPDTDQGMPTPGAGDHRIPAPGVAPKS